MLTKIAISGYRSLRKAAPLVEALSQEGAKRFVLKKELGETATMCDGSGRAVIAAVGSEVWF